MDQIRFFLTTDDDDDPTSLAGTCCQLDTHTMRVEVACPQGGTHTALLPASLRFDQLMARIATSLGAPS